MLEVSKYDHDWTIFLTVQILSFLSAVVLIGYSNDWKLTLKSLVSINIRKSEVKPNFGKIKENSQDFIFTILYSIVINTTF